MGGNVKFLCRSDKAKPGTVWIEITAGTPSEAAELFAETGDINGDVVRVKYHGRFQVFRSVHYEAYRIRDGEEDDKD